MAKLRDVWSTTHFITSEQIVNWLQGIAVSPRLTQTVNPHFWLTVMMPCKVSHVVTNEVGLSAGHQAGLEKPVSNAHNQIKFKKILSIPQTGTDSVLSNCSVIIKKSYQNSQTLQQQY